MRQAETANLLNLTERQVRNPWDKVRDKWVRRLAHGSRGTISLQKMSPALGQRIVGLVLERYEDFNPKLATEKLKTREWIRVSDEKLMQTKIGHGLWETRRKRGLL